MTWRKNDALANRGLDVQFNGPGVASFSLVNNGTASFNTGAPSVNPNAAQAGVNVATAALAADASAAATARTVTLQGTIQDAAANADGVVGNVRLADATGTLWMDGTAGRQGAAAAITAAALVGGIAQFTAAAHGVANGEQVEISGHSVAEYNGKWTAFNVTANTFQVFNTTAPGAGGTARKTFDVVLDNDNLAVGQPLTVTQWVVGDPV